MKIKEIRWSREASIEEQGRWVSAFQTNSYVARVEFEDGYVTAVYCKPGAASLPITEWVDYVSNKAHVRYETHKAVFSDPR